MHVRDSEVTFLKDWKEAKTLGLELRTWQKKRSFQNEGKIKTFLDKKLREFVTNKPALQEMFKVALRQNENGIR